MFHFALFLGSFAANFVAMWRAPIELAPIFYANYALANAIGSLYSTVVFTVLKDNILLKIAFGLGIFCLVAVSFLMAGNDVLVPVLYVGAILLGDYGISQSGTHRSNTIYRTTMIVTAVLFFVPFLEFYQAILLRGGIALLFFCVTLTPAFIYKPILLKAPWKFTALAYVFYSGTLILLPRLQASSEVIKNWYLVSQIGLALILKLADFASRSVYRINKKIEMLVVSVAGSLAILGCVLSPNAEFAAIYLVGALGLWVAVKKYAIVK